MSQKHEISCWKCHEMTSLETRNEFDGCCWACGEEIDLEDYLIKAMDKRDEHYAALSAVTAERDGLAAARMAYANEFAPDENGDPDVGNVHANIRALKAERDRLENELEQTELRALKFFHRVSAATDLGRELREALELIEKTADGQQCRQIAYDALEPFRARAAMAAKEA